MSGVVVGIDGSAVARNAAAWAGREAARMGTALRVVYADQTAQGVFARGHERSGEVREPVREWLDEAAAAAGEFSAKVTTADRPGSPERVLIEESETADLLVVGDRGFGGFAGLLAGAVAVKAATHARCSVVVVPDVGDPPRFPTSGPVVAGIDDPESAAPVLERAFGIAADLGVPLRAVHSWELAGLDLKWLRGKVPEEALAAAERRFVAEALAGAPERYPDVPVERVVLRGSPVNRLLDQARDAQLVVVGARGRGGVAGAHLGSTSHKLIHHAPCPLLIVRDAAGHPE
ncbi:universal stress protein [Saccharopolyspora griseoalba]|uniref:Universal stress protein n=1 Tax=Saccharopolyspora griseoalba TaxID=1431848 RepID=A0ABW2LJQ1_9PSEU